MTDDFGMRFIVYGAGGVGGVVGARLAQDGHDVVLIARGAHYEAIRGAGLRIESPDAVATLHLPVFNRPDQLSLSTRDIVLLAMKSQDTLLALDLLAAVAPAETPIVCMQNGVANESLTLSAATPTMTIRSRTSGANSSRSMTALRLTGWNARGQEICSRAMSQVVRPMR